MANPSATPDSGHGHFPPTRWSVVLEAQDADPQALARLCGDYWQPLYGFACRLTHDPEAAKDLTQGFFEHLLSKEGLRHVRQDRGKLRSFLLAALKSYSISQWRKGQRIRRGGGEIVVPMDGWDDTERQHQEPRHGLTPELEFDRAWARQLLAGVMAQLAAQYEQSGKAAMFAALRDRIEVRSDPGSYAETAAALGITEGAVRINVFKLRKRYRDLLQAAIAETVAGPEDLAEEVQYLMGVFAEPR